MTTDGIGDLVPKTICPACGDPSWFVFDDFEANMLRYAHEGKPGCWVRLANKQPRISDEKWQWTTKERKNKDAR